MAMARKVVVEMADDIDGSEATQTISFALRGVEYEIDLSDTNVAKLEEALTPYIQSGRRVGGRKRAGGNAGGVPAGIEPQAVRAWALEQGIEVGVRGRIPHHIVDQYSAATR
jgi:hypothetical protein